MQGFLNLVWFTFGNLIACATMDPCILQVVLVDGVKDCRLDPRRSATFHTIGPSKNEVFACLDVKQDTFTFTFRVPFSALTDVQQDHTPTGTCSAVAEPSETGLELTASRVVSLTIHAKSSARSDVDHVGMSGNLCKTTTPGAK